MSSGFARIFDACEVAFKNKRVYLDLSGLICGNSADVIRLGSNPFWLQRFQQALVLLDDYRKILYGSDWPLTPMAEYILFCKRLVPEESYDDVFYNNAAKIFGLGI